MHLRRIIGRILAWVGMMIAVLAISSCAITERRSAGKGNQDSLVGVLNVSGADMGPAEPNQELMLRAFVENKTPSDRLAAASGLVFSGNDQVVHFIYSALTNDYRDEEISMDDERALLELLNLLGVAGRKSDGAYKFLRKACDPDYWKTIKLWKSPSGDFVRYFLAGHACQAIGITRREDAIGFLEKLTRQKREVSELRNYAGGIATGAFYYDVLGEVGDVAFFGSIYHQHQEWFRFQTWKDTPSGEKWTTWHQSLFGDSFHNRSPHRR